MKKVKIYLTVSAPVYDLPYLTVQDEVEKTNLRFTVMDIDPLSLNITEINVPALPHITNRSIEPMVNIVSQQFEITANVAEDMTVDEYTEYLTALAIHDETLFTDHLYDNEVDIAITTVNDTVPTETFYVNDGNNKFVNREDFKSYADPLNVEDTPDNVIQNIANDAYAEMLKYHSFTEDDVKQYLTDPDTLEQNDPDLYEDIDNAYWVELEQSALNHGVNYYND